MSTTTSAHTYLPDDEGGLERLHELFDRPDTSRPHYYLTGADAEDRTEVPAPVFRALQQVVEAMRLGQAVTIQPQSRVLTTQQAADLLGMSRPTFVKLLDAGEIPFERVGASHRRVALSDVLGDGLSMVYSFFDPEAADRSLGTYMILDHIERAKAMGLAYVYLGYWVPGSRKMDYKGRFLPQERLQPSGWSRVER